MIRRALFGWLLGAGVGLACLAPLAAQGPAQDECAKARALAKQLKLVEAETAYRGAVKTLEQQAPAHENDALFWANYYRCLNEQAAHSTRMEQYADAEKQFKSALGQLTALQSKKFPNDASLRLALAKTHEGLGDMYRSMDRNALAAAQYLEAIRVLRKLTEENPAAVECRAELGNVLRSFAAEQMNLARFQDAELAHREEVQVWHKLVQDHTDVPDYWEKLASAYNAYATLARESGRFLNARDLTASAVQVLEQLQGAFPMHPQYWHELPAYYRNLAMPLEFLHLSAAKVDAMRAAERWERRLTEFPQAARPWLAERWKGVGNLQLRDLDRFNGSREEIDKLHQQAAKLLQEHPQVPIYRSQFVLTRILLAGRAGTAFEFPEAFAGYREAQTLNESLHNAFPQAARYRKLQAAMQIQVGILYYLKGEKQEGEQAIEAARALYRQLAAEFPDEPKLCRAEEDEMAALLIFLLSRDENDLVIDLMRRATASLTKACQRDPRCAQCRRHQAATPISMGHMFMRLKREKEAEQAYREGIELWSHVIADFPDTIEYHLFQCQAKSFLLTLYHRQKRWSEAEKLAQEMMAAHQKLIEGAPRLAYCHAGLATDHVWLATLAAAQQQTQPALEHYSRAATSCEIAFAMEPRDREYLQLLCNIIKARADVHQQAGNFPAYQADLQRSRDLAEWQDTALVRLTRIRQRLESGKSDTPRSDADDLFNCGDLTGAQWFELAEVFVLMLKTADAGQQDRYAVRAVAALRNALAGGFQPGTPLAHDTQFRLLTARPDFQQLAASKRD